ncbi:hypothetical protein [Arthrobacter ipis]|uniref:hypothetical protein n=1 Tax=Arthrobacter ipis TaxID=2716202 RepID=UPI001FE5D72A|nr:hypothetical protein [Arthrobacter ipis]
MTKPRRALMVIDSQQEYFDGLLQIQYPARDESIASIETAINIAQQNGRLSCSSSTNSRPKQRCSHPGRWPGRTIQK